MRIGPRQQDLLLKVAAVNEVGGPMPKSHVIDATASRSTQDSQTRIIAQLIAHGLLEDRGGLGEAEKFFSVSSRAYALHITDLGRECLAVLASKS